MSSSFSDHSKSSQTFLVQSAVREPITRELWRTWSVYGDGGGRGLPAPDDAGDLLDLSHNYILCFLRVSRAARGTVIHHSLNDAGASEVTVLDLLRGLLLLALLLLRPGRRRLSLRRLVIKIVWHLDARPCAERRQHSGA